MSEEGANEGMSKGPGMTRDRVGKMAWIEIGFNNAVEAKNSKSSRAKRDDAKEFSNQIIQKRPLKCGLDGIGQTEELTNAIEHLSSERGHRMYGHACNHVCP